LLGETAALFLVFESVPTLFVFGLTFARFGGMLGDLGVLILRGAGISNLPSILIFLVLWYA
jgi:hypothetical protein